jgi:hypothetical protein
MKTYEFKVIKTIKLMVYPYTDGTIKYQVLDGNMIVHEALGSDWSEEAATAIVADWIRDNYQMLDEFVNAEEA